MTKNGNMNRFCLDPEFQLEKIAKDRNATDTPLFTAENLISKIKNFKKLTLKSCFSVDFLLTKPVNRQLSKKI